jgi:hypothetical protein
MSKSRIGDHYVFEVPDRQSALDAVQELNKAIDQAEILLR